MYEVTDSSKLILLITPPTTHKLYGLNIVRKFLTQLSPSLIDDNILLIASIITQRVISYFSLTTYLYKHTRHTGRHIISQALVFTTQDYLQSTYVSAFLWRDFQ